VEDNGVECQVSKPIQITVSCFILHIAWCGEWHSCIIAGSVMLGDVVVIKVRT